MQCKCIKLINGESIIAKVDDEGEVSSIGDYVEVMDPVLIGSFRFPKMGQIIETHIFTPWLSVSSDQKIKIPTKNIMVVAGVKEIIAKQYILYISNVEEDVDFEETGEEEDLSDELDIYMSSMIEGVEQEESEEQTNDTRILH